MYVNIQPKMTRCQDHEAFSRTKDDGPNSLRADISLMTQYLAVLHHQYTLYIVQVVAGLVII